MTLFGQPLSIQEVAPYENRVDRPPIVVPSLQSWSGAISSEK
jgi:hypothetical protein